MFTVGSTAVPFTPPCGPFTMRLGTASLATGERVRVFHRSKDESWRTKHALGGRDGLVHRRATRTSRITDHCFARFTIRRACWRPALGSHHRRAGGSPGAESTSGDRVRCADRKMALPPPEIHIICLPGQVGMNRRVAAAFMLDGKTSSTEAAACTVPAARGTDYTVRE